MSSEMSSETPHDEPVPRNDDYQKKLDDPKFHERQDWVNALEKDFPNVPYYFLDLITSYVQANPEEAERMMQGEKFDTPLLDEWKLKVKQNGDAGGTEVPLCPS